MPSMSIRFKHVSEDINAQFVEVDPLSATSIVMCHCFRMQIYIKFRYGFLVMKKKSSMKRQGRKQSFYAIFKQNNYCRKSECVLAVFM